MFFFFFELLKKYLNLYPPRVKSFRSIGITISKNIYIYFVVISIQFNMKSALSINPSIYISLHVCPWCNGYRRRKCTKRHEFKSWTRLIAFHIALIPLGKV